MKKSLFFFLSLFVALPLSAQNPSNIGIKNLTFKYKHRVIPSSPQDPLFFNYGVNVDMTPAAKAIYDEPTVKNQLKIVGQNKIENPTDNDYNLSLKLGNVMIKSSNVNSNGSNSSFYVNVVYTFGSGIKLTKDGKVLQDRDLYSSDSERTHMTTTFKTQAEANNYWSNNKDVIKNDILKKAVDESIYYGSRFISMKYGFFIETESDDIKTMNEKKHSENITMNEKNSALVDKLKTLDGTTPLTEEELSDYIAYFNGLPEKYQAESKADAKIRYIAYYNLCTIYLLLDQPSNAITMGRISK